MCIHVRMSVFQLGQMQAGKFCPKNPASQHIFIKKKEKGKKKIQFGKCTLLFVVCVERKNPTLRRAGSRPIDSYSWSLYVLTIDTICREDDTASTQAQSVARICQLTEMQVPQRVPATANNFRPCIQIPQGQPFQY